MSVSPRSVVRPGERTGPASRRISRSSGVPWLAILSLVALINMSFLAGTIVMFADCPPASFLQKSYAGVRAWYERFRPPASEAPEDPSKDPAALWPRDDRKRPAVLVDELDAAYDGFTLVTSSLGCKAQLLDMRGRVAHEWSLPFSKAWPKAPHITLPVGDDRVYWFRAYLYPNGDLLAVFHAEHDTPYGYGLAKIDKDSHLLWTYSACVHHDVDVDEEGCIYILTQRIDDRMPSAQGPGSEHTGCYYLTDTLAVLSPDGQEITKVPLLEAFLASPYGKLLRHPKADEDQVDAKKPAKGDLLHTNSVKVLRRALGDKFPLFRAGQVLLSFRSQSLLAVVDVKQHAVVWAAQGPWHEQHDAEFLDNGRLLVFDNQGAFWKRGPLLPVVRQSRVLEYDPITQATPWCYPTDPDAALLSHQCGMKQRLPNGNTLVVDAEQNALLEVTSSQRLVWHFLGPRESEGSRHAFITGARRYAEAELPFMKGLARARP